MTEHFTISLRNTESGETREQGYGFLHYGHLEAWDRAYEYARNLLSATKSDTDNNKWIIEKIERG